MILGHASGGVGETYGSDDARLRVAMEATRPRESSYFFVGVVGGGGGGDDGLPPPTPPRLGTAGAGVRLGVPFWKGLGLGGRGGGCCAIGVSSRARVGVERQERNAKQK